MFNIVKGIPLEEIIRRYSPNLLINKGGRLWTLCPFHSEKTPSLSIKGQRWKCFGCGKGGSGLDYYMEITGINSPLEGAKGMGIDFGLLDELDKPLSLEQKQKIQARQRQQKLEKLWRQQIDKASQNLAETRRVLWLNMDKLPNPSAKAFTVELMDNALDVLEHGAFKDQLELIQTGAIERWLI